MSKTVENIVEYLKRYWKKLDQTVWRQTIYFSEETEFVLNYFSRILKDVFEIYSLMKAGQGQK